MTFELKNIIIYLDIYRNTISEVINLGMSETLKAISDPVRREILELLKDGRKTAGEISNSFNLTGATVSYHLSNLKKANLITETKQKNFIFYELNSSVFEDVLVWIYKLGGNKNGKKKKKNINFKCNYMFITNGIRYCFL